MKKSYYHISGGILLILLAFIMMAGLMPSIVSRAAAGKTYTASIGRHYAHPVTGVIEDSGGQNGMSIGQGMIESVISPKGLLEETDDGEFYLTVRMSLMDFTTNQQFQVQNSGDSDWSETQVKQTGTGTDSNGATADYCIQVPGKNCIVRGTMFVDPMGRDVIYYFNPEGYTDGNDSGLTATIVTEPSGSGKTGETESAQKEKPDAQGLNLSTAEKDGKEKAGLAGHSGHRAMQTGLAVAGGAVVILIVVPLIWYIRNARKHHTGGGSINEK